MHQWIIPVSWANDQLGILSCVTHVTVIVINKIPHAICLSRPEPLRKVIACTRHTYNAPRYVLCCWRVWLLAGQTPLHKASWIVCIFGIGFNF